MTALYYTTTLKILYFYSHWNNSHNVDMSIHADILPWLQKPICLCPYYTNICVFSKVSKYHAIIIVLGFTWQWIEPAFFRTLGDHAFVLTFTLPSQSANLGWIRIIVSETIGKPRVNPHYTAEPIGKPRVNPHYTAEPIGKARVITHYTVEPIFKPRVNPLHSF